ncbi:fungal pheromone STE3G-protein-coupled receptor, partial [Mycena polygramma]
LNRLVNSPVRRAGNTLDVTPAWCEISIRIMMGASVGLPAASLCINRRLYHIASVRAVVVTHAEKRRAVLIDSLICGLFPLLYIALQYIVQGHRYDLPVHRLLPRPLKPCVRSLRAFASLLSAHAALTPSRYLRLSALALTDLLLTAPLAAFTIALNATVTPISPWLSWADTHFDFDRVVQIPRLAWAGAPDGHAAKGASGIAIELTRWASPACALIFVGFFVFAQEARRNYGVFFGRVGAAFWRVLARAGVARPTS